MKNHYNIIVTPADKNLGLSLLRLEDYHNLTTKHLELPQYRKLITSDVETLINSNDRIQEFITRRLIPNFENENGKLDKRTILFLSQRGKAIPKFHILPKFHKKFKSIMDIGVRPINGAISAPNTNLSKFISIELGKITWSISSILRNTKELTNSISKIDKIYDENILFSFDYSALYTNIPVNDLLKTFKENGISKFIIEAIEIVCKEVYLNYNDTTYTMDDGIPMGLNCAVELANLYLYYKIDSKIQHTSKLRSYHRYIDDIFGIWTGSRQELVEFKGLIDSLTPSSLCTTEEWSYYEIHVLDIWIYKKNGKLEYRTYQKELNQYQYLMPTSLHPQHTMKGYIMGEILRYERTNSEHHHYENMKKLFFRRLMDRGFSATYLLPIFIRPRIRNMQILRDSNPTVLCLPYSTRKIYSEIKLATRKLANYISLSPSDLLITTSQPPNISSIITRSSLSVIQKEEIEKQKHKSEEETVENLIYIMELPHRTDDTVDDLLYIMDQTD
jgi:hypothetical protein